MAPRSASRFPELTVQHYVFATLELFSVRRFSVCAGAEFIRAEQDYTKIRIHPAASRLNLATRRSSGFGEIFWLN
jgi:hypothetical protein